MLISTISGDKKINTTSHGKGHEVLGIYKLWRGLSLKVAVFDGGGMLCIGSYFRAGRLSSYCCVEGLRGNHIKFRARRKPLLSSLKRDRACKYRGIRNLYRAMYANWTLSTPNPPTPPTTAQDRKSKPRKQQKRTTVIHALA